MNKIPTLADRLKKTRIEIQALKNTQFMGQGSIQAYNNQTNSQFDGTGYATVPGQSFGTYSKVYSITATATTQNVLFGDLIFDLYIGSSDIPYDYRTHYLDFPATYFDAYKFDVDVDAEERNIVKWGFVVTTNSNSTNLYSKFYIIANDIVNIQIKELAGRYDTF